MQIVLSCENFDAFGGTETYTLTAAQQLEALGHDVAIYSPNRGAMAEFARGEGMRVLGIDELPSVCDLVVFGDAATCHELSSRYGDAVRMFVVHSRDHALQYPPQLDGCCHAVIVLNDRVRRTVEARGWHAPIVRLSQPIDTARFRNLGPPRRSARRALLLSNYLTGPRTELLESACRANCISLSWIGVPASPTATPEHAIANADMVFALGRSALEGMAAGRAVYVYGAVGGDGWVTPDRYPAMEADGFAGLSDRGMTIDVARLTADLAEWKQMMGEVNRDLVLSNHEAREHAIELVSLARTVEAREHFPGTAANELAYLVRRERQAYARCFGALAEASQLRSQLSEAEVRLGEAGAHIAQASQLRSQLSETELQLGEARARITMLEGSLRDIRGTRRYRLAVRLARPLDRLRESRQVQT